MATKTKTAAKAVNQDIGHELVLLRSLVISMVGQDAEGEYKPAFVEKILRSSKEKPTKTFSGADAFLKQIQAA